MQEIGDWLATLGLSRYARLFEDNGIDLSVLADLTDQDLEKLGIVVGHRRKLLREIAKLKEAENRSATAAAQLPLDAAERRQVTVMFSDLVGSTALSTRLDPEDLREIIAAYQKCVTETVRRCGGFVANYMGDGVLVYFGYPEAHEDDAAQAVSAGLELIAAVAALATSVPLQTRVGIATGLVVAGSLIGPAEAPERAIVGETPNLAARLQAIAEPDTVVIAESTRRLLGNLFEFKELEARSLKGIAGPVRTWVVQRTSSVASRFEALHAGELTDLVNRQEEMELLLRRWSSAKAGKGQVVLLTGEAGIGKSRLTVALLEKLAGEPHRRLRYFCSAQHPDSMLYPVIGQIERAAGLARDDTPQAKLDKLDAMLAETSTAIEDAGLLAEMLSLANDGRYPAPELMPQQRRQKTLDALIRQLEALTRQAPVLVVFEDVHWADPTTLEILGRTVDRIANIRALLIVTGRPEFQRRIAEHRRAAARADQAPGRAHRSADSRQRICCAADQSRGRACAPADRTGASRRRTARRSLDAVLGAVRLLDGEHRGLQRRRGARTCGAIHDAGGEPRRQGSADGRSPHGRHLLPVHRRHRASASASRSRDRAL